MERKNNQNSEKTSKKLYGRMKLPEKLHWSNSSSVLCNYMRKPEHLEMILKNKAIIPRYVMEPVEYLGLANLDQICIAMTCFCDIPFSKTDGHMKRYGRYGIAFDKNTAIHNYKIQTVHYMTEDSPLLRDFRKAYQTAIRIAGEMDEKDSAVIDYVLSTLVYMKPIAGEDTDADGNVDIRTFQDEREWRYIPENMPDGAATVLRRFETSQKGRDTYTKLLENHPESWLHFEWKDIQYLMVPDQAAAEWLIGVISGLNIERSEQLALASKITISQKFSEDLT